MKGRHLVGATLPLLASTVEATLPIQQNGILSFPVKASAAKTLTKRQQSVGVENQIEGTLYTIDIAIGTPGQTVSVQLDTSSDELWINPVCSKSFNPDFCTTGGRFTSSSTLVDLNVQGGRQGFLGYAEWEYVYDYMTVGSARIGQQIFGTAYDSEYFAAGVLGVAPSLSGWESPYPYILDTLFYQGYINSRAFSLDLRDIDSEDGAVIFGGIDTLRYSESLQRIPIVPASASPDSLTRYWVNVNGITISREDDDEAAIVASGVQAFDLNSGLTFSGLPGLMFDNLIAAFPEATLESGSSRYVVDCSIAEESGAVSFTFGGTVIDVPFSDFIWQASGTCYLAVFRSDGYPVLGANFLRAAYVVFDMDNREIHIANAVRNRDCGTNLVAIGSGQNAVPSIVGTCTAAPEVSPTPSSAPVSSAASSAASSVVSSEVSSAASSLVSSLISSLISSVPPVSTSLPPSSSIPASSIVSSSIESISLQSSTSLDSSTASDDTAPSSVDVASSTILNSASSTFALSSDDVSSTINSAPTSPSSSLSVDASASTISSAASTSSGTESASASSTLSTHQSSDHSSLSTESLPASASSTLSASYGSGLTAYPPSVTSATGPKYGITALPPSESVTVVATTTYTITSCREDVVYCPIGEVTTEVVTRYTTFCPETTATYTLPNTYTFVHETSHSLQERPPVVVTVVPAPTYSAPVEVPGCSEGTAGASSRAQDANEPSSGTVVHQHVYETSPPAASETSILESVLETTSKHGSVEETTATPSTKHWYHPIFSTVTTNNTTTYPTSTISADEGLVTAAASLHGLSGLLSISAGLLALLML